MSATEIAEPVAREVTPPRPGTSLERLERTISEAESRMVAQETLIAEAALTGQETAWHSFELQKMQLLVAILREGRQRLLELRP
jgi:hypothetical protein